ncbi:MAG: DUF6688 domain-containing protein [Cellulosilyticaceae bacterium]
MERIKKHPIVLSILFVETISLVGVTLGFGLKIGQDELLMYVITVVLGGLFVCYPILLTLINIVFTIRRDWSKEWLRIGRRFECITLWMGLICSWLLLQISRIQMDHDWMDTLYNDALHTPIFTQSRLTIFVIGLIGIGGYLLLSCEPLKQKPPLVIVLSMAGMYLGMLECVLWIVQIGSMNWFLLMLLPFNCILIGIKVIRLKVEEWQQIQEEEKKQYHHEWLNHINQKLADAKKWPFVAFVIMWPLFGILMALLVLFGQEPSAFIKAWTETSDWNLSQRIAPPNLTRGGHYLCTVAAGGHQEVVKPIRLGIRGGKPIVVNRQLCIANAFEQIIEERLPTLHGVIRRFYDAYGLPVSRMIRSPYVADLVYIVMKPLEWLFLIVIYLCDVNPEDRIATQYMGTTRCHDNK